LSNPSVSTCKQQLDLKPSFLLFSLLLLQEGCVIAALWQLPIFAFLKLLSIMAVLATTYYAARLSAFRNLPQSITHLIEVSDGWTLVQHNGHAIDAKLMGESYHSAVIIVLLFKSIKQRFPFSVIITKESLDEISWRRLRAYLTRVSMSGNI
jgi:hypothetical protein